MTLSDATAVKPTFTAPDNGTYVFQVTVTDASGAIVVGVGDDDGGERRADGDVHRRRPPVNEGATFTISLTSAPRRSRRPGDAHDVARLRHGDDRLARRRARPADTGTVTVTGTVTDKDGGSTTYTRAVTVRQRSADGERGRAVQRAPPARRSRCTGRRPIRACPTDTLTFAWDCDYNGTTDATGANATCTYSFPGTYTATLKVTDQ